MNREWLVCILPDLLTLSFLSTSWRAQNMNTSTTWDMKEENVGLNSLKLQRNQKPSLIFHFLGGCSIQYGIQ